MALMPSFRSVRARRFQDEHVALDAYLPHWQMFKYSIYPAVLIQYSEILESNFD